MSVSLNRNYKNLKESYLFSEVKNRVNAYAASHPEAKIIRLGIGDVTLPLTPAVTAAMSAAVSEMGDAATFRGYAPEYGYDFIREAVAKYYGRFGVRLSADEVFVSDGAKTDVGNIVDIFGDSDVLIPDPVYPVYLDSNIMSGRRVTFLRANLENNFLPTPEGLSGESYIIYLCSPNNPTGATYTREGLRAWVDYARKSGSLIVFDSAYEAYIHGDYPHSIYEVEGARECAIEICSLSKSAGFTGTRCAWTVMPAELTLEGERLSRLWARRQATKFNGVPYIIQRGAEAALSEQGIAEWQRSVDYYMGNASLIASVLRERGVWFSGGECSPYIWLKCPGGEKSWDFFDRLLDGAHLVGTPGAGFGSEGEGYFRLTSFGSRENTEEAVERLRKFL